MTDFVAAPGAFRGIWPALMTPLQASLDIDHGRFAAHARALIDAGCGGVTPFGTTGEGPSFSVFERTAAVDALAAGGIDPARIIVSTMAAAPTDVLTLTRHAQAIGAHGCLMLPPFYFKGVSDQGVLDGYRWLIDRATAGGTPLRLYLYHIPQVAAVGLSQAVIATLLREYPGVVAGIKDSAGDRAHSQALAAAFMPPLTVYVGHEPDLPTMGRLGSTGAISGLANFWPHRVLRLVARPDDAATADDLARTEALLKLLGGYALIPALKAIQAWRDGDDAWRRVRPPLVALSADAARALQAALAAIGFDPRDD